MEPIGCPETSVKDYQNTLCNNAVERRSLLLRGGSPPSCSISDLNIGLVQHVTVLMTNQLSTWGRVVPEEIAGSQLVKNFPVYYGTGMFNSKFAIARHLSLS